MSEPEHAPLDIAVTDHGRLTVVALSGELDFSNVERFVGALSIPFDAEVPRTIVDLTALRFVDSSGLNALILLQRRYQAGGGDLHLVVSDSRLLRLFQITGLDQVFRLLPTLDAAMERDSGGNPAPA
jgi:anti-sigma B factor antagonist